MSTRDIPSAAASPTVAPLQVPSQPALEEVFRLKHPDLTATGWSPRLRWRFRYFSPEDQYEALVSSAVGPDTRWLDVGCGRFLFPSNDLLARRLADRCRLLVGVDPDATIHENPYVHHRVQGFLSDYNSEQPFDLVTLRMVAEHVTEPNETVSRIASLLRPGGLAIVYTVFKWSPAAVLARAVPFRAHHPIKRVLWGSEEKDTFPVVNRMNTRSTLRRLFESVRCQERLFMYLDDCRSFGRFRVSSFIELLLWRVLRSVGLRYPELCIVGVYEKSSVAPADPTGAS